MQGCLEGEAYSFNDERSAQEFAFHTDYLFEIGMKKGYENHHGRSSDQMMPFFEITCKGKGYIAAIGWTGCWRAEFEREKGRNPYESRPALRRILSEAHGKNQNCYDLNNEL